MRSNGAHSSLVRPFEVVPDVFAARTEVIFSGDFTDFFGEIGGGNFHGSVLRG
jgi:hypothetical protein